MSTKQLRVGIIGAGLYAAVAHIPQFQALEQVEVVAITRRNPERLAMVQNAFGIANAYTDWQAMLAQESLDAVVISTPHNLHYEPTIAALQQGLHVLVEKPMALTSQEAWAMVHAAKVAQRVLMVGYPSHVSGKWRTVKQEIATNTLGTVRQINLAVSFYRRWFWEQQGLPADIKAITAKIAGATGLPPAFFVDWGQTWHHDPRQMGGGAFVDNGTHHIDRMLWLAGSPAVEVVAMTEAAEMPVECFVNVQARLASGVLFSMTAADAVPQDLSESQEQLMIVGDDAILTNDPDGGIWIYQNGDQRKLEVTFADQTKAAAFVAAIEAGDIDDRQAHEAAHAVDFMEALYRSAAERRIIAVDELRR